MPAMMAETFPPRVRYTAVAIAYDLGISLFGGLPPLIVVALSAYDSKIPWPGLLMVAAATLTLPGPFAMPRAGGPEPR